MAYDVSALNNYTIENAELLVLRSLFSSKTMKLIQAEGTVMTGVKTSEQIEIMETDAIFQQGGTCGFNSSGNTRFTQREVKVGKIKVNESLCPKTLESKYTQKALQKGSRYDAIPFEQDYTDRKAGKIAEQLETAVWQGDTTSPNVNLNKFDGLIKLNDASGQNINANQAQYIAGGAISAATGITIDNVRKIVGSQWLALPAALQGKADLRIFCGWDTFSKFISAYTDQNLFNFAPKGSELSAENDEIVIPGTSYRLSAVHGLDGTNRLFTMRTSNLYLATDLENEEEKWEIFFAKEADEVRFVAEFKDGVNVAFPDEVVTFKLTA
ncbi:hypothetical protein [Mucilaginibacter pedocola]|uniref:Phage capsid protein n=1 Tax=Mucilaginibacter pedocola TaxID=1792845 RepID=A0A1S9P865_9SPHI|nr:hypothetical protein [Mucilaginibacter pedocola]OOQ57146.1 hypothetical protein BC343_16635 [Mucilaginibacter pedocola]